MTALRELVAALLVAALAGLLLAPVLWLAKDAGGLPQTGPDGPPWFMVDALGAPLLESFPGRAWKTLQLVAPAALIALALGLFVAVITALRPRLTPLRLLFGALSCLPVFVVAYLIVQSTPGAGLGFAALTLAIADLNLGGLIARLHETLERELASDHMRAVRSRGASPARHLWRPLAVAALLSLRTRLPILFAATVVAERAFGIAGLGDQASYAVLDLPDPVFLAWFALFTVVVTRIVHVFARGAEALIVPRSRDEQTVGGLIGGFLSAPRRRPARPLREPAAPPPRPATERLREAGRAFAGRFGIVGVSLPARLGGLLLTAPFWIVTLGLLIGAGLVDSEAIYGATRHQAPGPESWLGTDGLQRDVLVQVLLGARWSLPWWGLAVLVPTTLGLITGALSAGGGLSGPLNLLMEALDALPKLVVVLLCVAAFGVDRYLTVGLPVMGLTFAPYVHAHIEARVRELIRARFVEAEQVAGASRRRTLLLHVLWNNCSGLVLSCAATILGGVVLLDATCGYLQIAQRELCAWGALFYDNIQAWNTWAGTGAPFNEWSALGPLLASTATIVTFTALGEGLGAALAGEAGRS